ncbi:murein hydrolase activator EnvC family protein [Kineococcus sp. SYSU DK018]|uniref:murein hydrolase activator EnvC family protein n=1 Tax=Kineococcus sp. SYSU DK018 TaxID=3383139 RepID=UPI003D7E8A8B
MPSSTASALFLAGAGAAALAVLAPSAGPAPSGPTPATAASAPGPVRGGAGPWTWPLEPRPVVLRGYDDVGRYAPGHRGLDLAASPGQQVLAPAAGAVVFAGPVAGRGVVVLEHAGGLRTSYEPVTASAPVGTRLERGDVLGALAEVVHCGQGPCLHLGLRRDQDYLDPLPLLEPAPAPVLLPLGRPA